MKSLNWLVLALGLAQAGASQAQAPGNAIDVDADVHQVVLENEFAGGGRVIAIEVKSAEAALRTGAKPSQ